ELLALYRGGGRVVFVFFFLVVFLLRAVVLVLVLLVFGFLFVLFLFRFVLFLVVVLELVFVVVELRDQRSRSPKGWAVVGELGRNEVDALRLGLRCDRRHRQQRAGLAADEAGSERDGLTDLTQSSAD